MPLLQALLRPGGYGFSGSYRLLGVDAAYAHINRLNPSSGFPSHTGQLALNGQLCLVVLGAKNLPVRSDGTLNSFVKG